MLEPVCRAVWCAMCVNIAQHGAQLTSFSLGRKDGVICCLQSLSSAKAELATWK